MSRGSRIFLLVLASVELAAFGFAQTAPKASTPDLTGVWTTYRGPGGASREAGAVLVGRSRNCLCGPKRRRKCRSISD